eukprot:267340_1
MILSSPHVTLNSNQRTNELMGILFDSCDNYESRLIHILTQHKHIFIDDNTALQKDNDIIRFIQSFHSTYKLINFLNDFSEYIDKTHQNDLYAEQFYTKLLQNIVPCQVEKCISIARNHRNKTLCKDNNFRLSLYGSKNISNEEVVHHQIMDSVHVHIFHLFDKGHKLFQSEREKALENTYYDADGYQINTDINSNLVNMLSHKAHIFKKQCAKHIETKNTVDSTQHNKFVTIIPVINQQKECFIQRLMIKLVSYKINENSLKYFYQCLNEEEYDTDAICDDIKRDNSSNLKIKLKDDSFFYLLQRYCYDNNANMSVYSFGFRYYYWKFFENNQNERNVIYTQPNQRKRSWYDNGNKGYKAEYFFICPKYDSLKEEITNNDIFCITMKQF